jgi:Flavin containing amine oxidoreductase
MANYVIVGAGASGLYTAYRLLSGGTLQSGDTVQLFEWSDRVGGRIYTYSFPPEESWATNGLYVEVGGMRFATDANFPDLANVKEGHVLVQNVICALDLQDKVVPFIESPQRMYYLRGMTFWENGLAPSAVLNMLPYHFNLEFLQFLKTVPEPQTADNILGAIAAKFAPGLGSRNEDRPRWAQYFANGAVTDANATTAFPAGTPMRDIGYWNLLYDQLGDEGFDYAADGTGYTSNVINWNSADAMQANNDYGSGTNYSRLDGGYSILFEALRQEVSTLMNNYPGSGIFTGSQLTSLAENPFNSTTTCIFNGDPTTPVSADQLFLAMPRRSLELVAAGCAPDYVLNDPRVKFNLESSIDQPAIKAVMVFDEAWWMRTDPPYLAKPVLTPPDAQGVGGPAITDLPLRMIYYFGNNIPGGPGTEGGPYVLLASYDDMNYSDFWRQLETQGDYTQAPSLTRQPLTGPTSVPVDSPLANLLLKQLADVHYLPIEQMPTPLAVLFQDWGQDPFGGGYHGWAPHYDITQVMDTVRAPYANILANPDRKVYIIGSCYSFDQAWVEGAFCTAESVLQDFVGLKAFNGISDYMLICKPSTATAAPTAQGPTVPLPADMPVVGGEPAVA